MPADVELRRDCPKDPDVSHVISDLIRTNFRVIHVVKSKLSFGKG